jgi:DNA-binding NtrC family response regulator
MANMAKILLVDDDVQALESMKKILEMAQHEVVVAPDGEAALELMSSPEGLSIALVISDIRMPKLSGLEFLKALSVSKRNIPVVLMTAFGRVEDAVWAMKFGAVDFLSKPFKRQILLDAVTGALKRSTKTDPESKVGLIGKSPLVQNIRHMIQQVAPTTATVLILGESGTGKEKVARSIHDSSARAQKPFVAINCAALPDGLLESELFGYEKGAFTGAQNAKPGLFEVASGGTILLDEIGDMPLSLQAKLLRVIQEGEVRRVGASSPRKTDVRIIASTHRNLKQMVKDGSFRQDLLFRLEVVTLDLPALRARASDIPELAQHFLTELSQRHGKSLRGLSVDALQVMMAYAWPGNIRELQNVVERAVVFASSPQIEVADLPAHLMELCGKDLGLASVQLQSISVPLGTKLKDVEELMIRKTLEATQGDKNVTAKLLGINSRTIYRKLSEGQQNEGDDSPPTEV